MRDELIRAAELSRQQQVSRWVARLRRKCKGDADCEKAIDGLMTDRRKLQQTITRRTSALNDLRNRVQEYVGRYKLNRAKPGDKPSLTLTPYAQSLVDRKREEENEKRSGDGLYTDPSRANCNQHLT